MLKMHINRFIRNIDSIFYGFSSLETINLPNLNIPLFTNMNKIFLIVVHYNQ